MTKYFALYFIQCQFFTGFK